MKTNNPTYITKRRDKFMAPDSTKVRKYIKVCSCCGKRYFPLYAITVDGKGEEVLSVPSCNCPFVGSIYVYDLEE